MFFMNSTSAPDAAAVEPSGINTLLGNDSRAFFINGKAIFINGSTSLPKSQTNCIFLNS